MSGPARAPARARARAGSPEASSRPTTSSVAKVPGNSPTTRTPRGASSSASCLAVIARPGRRPLETARPGSGATAASTASAERAFTSTRALSATRAWATANPSPRLAPVTRYPRPPRPRSMRCASAAQRAQHVLHDPAVAVVARLAGGVDPHGRVELHVARLDLHRAGRAALVQLGDAGDRE